MAYKLYNYNPSGGAAIPAAALFGLATVLHILQMIRARSWYMIPFTIGGVFEAIGYLCRYINFTETPDWQTTPYIGQSLLILLAPALFAASIYMILGRLIVALNASSNSIIRPSWLTKIFVIGDLISFLMQCGGGGFLASAKTPEKVEMGEHMILGGLFVQIFFFGIFIIVSVIFHRRMLASPMNYVGGSRIPWSRCMKVMYTLSCLIMVRSIYRVIEYAQGSGGYFQSKEAFVYVFDAALMLACCVVLLFLQPSKMLGQQGKGYRKSEDLEMLAGRQENGPNY
ncbi:RTA1 domain protein [Penicillium canescens]|uniref:RTA1 domain protein n=1 Tax=Penicillium canescens TaxID=5083 RepID=A0AAD6I5L4_PENCN|nr:RTA1 domain protein [Penicillium canescens]KAJ6018547.1 RTA1 domain protein [Penicillium canescens]KAJ6034153.1 RTA1 domain protein [Penicillium canescens]KAJ6039272.1 RTA1 domain protein [Penicillium canescens]KAJ6066121.1 RTA1 domain protein [Penicillium canescens]KAJ6091107.1 RTA1 domain protein [Penicillium canescens]